MPWLKVDDSFHGHPKVIGLSPAAVGVWTLSGSWSSQYLTEGFVSVATLRRIGGNDELALELVDAGLWTVADGGFQFHDWLKYNPTKAAVEAEREAARERMARSRAAKRAHTPGAVGSEGVRPNIDRTSAEVRLTPTHPDPTHPKEARSPAGRVNTYSVDFEAWWAGYPRKTAKAAAARAFEQALTEVGIDVLTAAAQSYALSNAGTDRRHLKQADGWLRDRRWEDGPSLSDTSDKNAQTSCAHRRRDVQGFCFGCGDAKADAA